MEEQREQIDQGREEGRR